MTGSRSPCHPPQRGGGHRQTSEPAPPRRRRSQDDLHPPKLPRLAESQAAIQEAREYLGRVERAIENLRALRKAGVEVDVRGVSRDERLETLLEVLPAVDELERERDRALDQAERWRSELGGREAEDTEPADG